jgi:undecaprenyl-diphosphatase
LETLKAIILGIVQGCTEFFPVSSSGHLIFIPFLFNWDYIPVYYSVTLHFATLLSLLSIFYQDCWRIVRALFYGIFKAGERKSSHFKLSIFIIVATIPAALAGVLLDDYIESFFNKPIFVGIFLLITALFLFLGEIIGKWLEKNQKTGLNKGCYSNSGNTRKKIGFLSSLVTGIGQAIAILPGISRSGTTISFARSFGIKREECVKFSMLLSIPVIFGAFVFELAKSYEIIIEQNMTVILNMLLGFIFAYASGFLSIKFLLRLTRKRNLNFFAIYCIVIAIIIFILSGIRTI